jgi:hypothetical protein
MKFLAEDAVYREPFSGPYSLLSGNFAANLRLCGRANSVKALVDRAFSKRADASIAKLSRELNEPDQGIFRQDQGILIREAGTLDVGKSVHFSHAAFSSAVMRSRSVAFSHAARRATGPLPPKIERPKTKASEDREAGAGGRRGTWWPPSAQRRGKTADCGGDLSARRVGVACRTSVRDNHESAVSGGARLWASVRYRREVPFCRCRSRMTLILLPMLKP